MTREMLLALALGYLLGSIPFGLLLTRLAGKGDVRDIGSGSIGATNVLRTGSKPLAARDAVLDCLKATAAVLLAQRLFGPETGARGGGGRADRPPLSGLAEVPAAARASRPSSASSSRCCRLPRSFMQSFG